MILSDKTLIEYGYAVDDATSHQKIYVKCDDCDKEYSKSKRDLKTWNGKCASCFGKIRGPVLGNKYGKTQKQQGSCLTCKTSISLKQTYCQNCAICITCGVKILPTASYCDQCRSAKQSVRFSGAGNPAFKGFSQICKCGSKKTRCASSCRKCSFKNGTRTGTNNGRYVSDNREEYLEQLEAADIARNCLSNVIKSYGIKKTTSTFTLLKYSKEEFKEHIQSKFDEKMTWENHGLYGWHVDHIIPVSFLVKNDIKDPAVINALWNLRPLNSQENHSKNNKLTKDSLETLRSHLPELYAKFIETDEYKMLGLL